MVGAIQEKSDNISNTMRKPSVHFGVVAFLISLQRLGKMKLPLNYAKKETQRKRTAFPLHRISFLRHGSDSALAVRFSFRKIHAGHLQPDREHS